MLAAIAQHRPDAIVLDQHLSGTSGLEPLEELRMSPTSRRLPIVVATGDGQPEGFVPTSDPLTRYLPKPVDLHQLAATIDYLINHADQLLRKRSRSVRRALRATQRDRTTFEQALHAAQQGHQVGFAYRHRDLFTRLHNYARAQHHPDPADLAREALLTAFTRIHQFQGNEPQFKAWVFRIAFNALLDSARKRAVRPVETLVDLTPIRPAGDNPEASAIGNLALADLLVKLDVLTPEQREVVVLRVIADLTVVTIAELLDKTPEAVKALQRRAFSTLATTLGGDGRRVHTHRVQAQLVFR